MSMQGMYAYAIKVAQGKFHGTTEEHDGKLVFKGSVATQEDKNAIWDAIKTIPTWQKDVQADIQVTGGSGGAATTPSSSTAQAPSSQATSAGKTYTVKAGDTLSQIAKDHLGSASAYPQIFELNKDQLTDPDKIKPGQVLRLP